MTTIAKHKKIEKVSFIVTKRTKIKVIMNNITIKKRVKTKLVNNIPQTNCVIIMVCNACELVNMKQA
jgi:hypothetical protein